MNKIFIDCGANDGCSVRKFLNEWPNAHEYKIFSFECNPMFFNCFKGLSTKLIPKAVYINETKLNFYAQKSKIAGGSSLYKEKINLNQYHQYQVTTIDLNKWIRDNFTKEDYIILKLDIEGAEYEVLNHLIENGTISWINEFYAEFHAHKLNIPNIQETHDKLLQKLEELNVEVKYWDAFSYSIKR